VESGEEERSRRVGEEFRLIGKEVGEGKGVGEEKHKTKVLFEETSSNSRACRRKGEKPFMDEETQRQKALVEPGFVNAFDQACGFAFNIPCTHVDLTRIVVDIESKNAYRVNEVGLGQSKELVAHETDG